MIKAAVIFIVTFISVVDSAKVLAIFPSACFSHHEVYWPIVNVLLEQGHEVVLITTHPKNKTNDNPKNLIVIDIKDVSIKAWAEAMQNITTDNSVYNHGKMAGEISNVVLEKQLQTKAVQDLLTNTEAKFDLVLLENYIKPLYYFAFKYNVPTILISSTFPIFAELVGASSNFVIYPDVLRRKFYNLTISDTIFEFYQGVVAQELKYGYDGKSNDVVKKIDSNAPGLDILYNYIDFMFVSEHRIRDLCRPAPIPVVYLYGIHIKPQLEISKDIQDLLDSSTHGALYLSFGTSVSESQLPQDKIQTMLKVLSELPYTVLWKWNAELPGTPANVHVSKWFQQADILRHPKMKLFITQGGLQSIDESIAAGVPLLGMPILFDQFGNIDKVVHFGCGKQMDLFSLTEDEFRDTVKVLAEDKNYRKNVEKIRTIFYDQPQSPQQSLIWWTNYILRHKSARHLRSPAANLPWFTFFEVELVLIVLFILLVLVISIWITVKRLIQRILNMFRKDKVKNV